MSRSELVLNLERMLGELRDYCVERGIDPEDDRESAAERIAQHVFLAHATSSANFAKICASDVCLLSPAELDRRGLKALKADAVERILKTTGSVFFYASAFSFPSSGCGVLFATSLEKVHSDNGCASPFDSGALVNHFQRPEPKESPLDFLRRHRLPLSEYRGYLAQCLAALFVDPFDYVRGVGRCHEGPIGLTGGDPCRRSTCEVRIPDKVEIRSPHLQAVFAPARVCLQPHVEELLRWSDSEGFDVVTFESDRENDFERLKNECIQYLRQKLN